MRSTPKFCHKECGEVHRLRNHAIQRRLVSTTYCTPICSEWRVLMVPTPGLEPGTPWCLLRRCFFQLQSGALPTELSEVFLPTLWFYLFSSSRLIHNLLQMWGLLKPTSFPTSVNEIDLFWPKLRFGVRFCFVGLTYALFSSNLLIYDGFWIIETNDAWCFLLLFRRH